MGSDEELVTVSDLRELAEREISKPLELMVTREDLESLQRELEKFAKGVSPYSVEFVYGAKDDDFALVFYFRFGTRLDVVKEVRVVLMPEEWAV